MAPRRTSPAEREEREPAEPVGGGMFTSEQLERKFAAYEELSGGRVSRGMRRLLHAILSTDTDDAGRSEEEQHLDEDTGRK